MIPVSSGMTSEGVMRVDLTLDWLSFTYKSPNAPDDSAIPYNHFRDFCRDFPVLQEFISREGVTLARQRGWYNTVLQFCDNIRINYNDDHMQNSNRMNSNHLGVNVEIPSHGLSKIFSLFGFREDQVMEFFSMLKDRHCKASRIDLAFDDFSKTFTPRDFICFYLDGCISSHYQKCNLIASNSMDGGTFYLGDRSSGKMLRVYDKAYESKGQIDSVRYEVELHSQYADEMMRFIADGNEISFSSYIPNFLRVITREGVRHMSGSSLPVTLTSDRSHCPSDPRWSEFLDKMQVLRIVESKIKVPHSTSGVSRLKLHRWINSISGSLRAYKDIVGDFLFDEIIATARVPDRYILSIPELSSLYFEDRHAGIYRSSDPCSDRFVCDLI